ncbi:putative Mitochondrial ornithine carrier protein [Taphrina deformans PYCC 5710]|uniref:Mitochondrial ornithine carrier protein n=1 Tax=Taphrina deformans (strain PYCC 5710 / ATCC 11124 / CBS 356.35 / IMI 108563 / JCM 9778 / NBRC 8474) TaxID=1097556 RepID=R4X6Y6_TAPDE|nr:putative Mitochondrial ornithine carrier protein [Taphrina deformans PYCC 5710]|eukprot:CCG80997.1 putative Mitochondrial ornithine carrier protein [Taphrina deformans PYCC 5710]
MSEQSATEIALKEIAFGSISGIAGKFVEYPFDTIKVRLQSQPSTGIAQYSSTFDCIKQTLDRDGYRALYRGLSAPMVGAMFENAVLFVTYSKASDVVRLLRGKPADSELDTAGIMTSGALSGAVTSFVLTPVELVKCRLQIQTTLAPSMSTPAGKIGTASALKNNLISQIQSRKWDQKSPVVKPQQQSITQLISEIYTTKGLLGFWRGQFSTLIRESGGSCCWFSIYELSLRALRPIGTTKSANTQGHMMLAGGLAGVGYNTLFFPFDTIKSRMQTNASNSSFSDAVKEVWKSNGIRGYFKGWGITVARAAPSNALIFWVYESLSRRYMKA